MYKDRVEIIKKIEAERNSKVILYVTGDRVGAETQIHPEVLDLLIRHLDKMGVTSNISLVLYTRGGHTSAAWSIVNLIRQFCSTFEVILPSKGLSTGTLICLGADKIIMTKQATLGPIDPSVNTPLNPSIPGFPPEAPKLPVSVEAINGYLELAKEMGIDNSEQMVEVLKILSNQVHPLVLGEVFRTRSQIRMLGRRLLSKHLKEEGKIDRILSFLCSESGSHDYMISRTEARDELGLTVENPNDNLYNLINALYYDFADEMKFTEPFAPQLLVDGSNQVEYNAVRALVESINCGSHQFVTTGKFIKTVHTGQNNSPVENIQNIVTYEGWKYNNV